MERKYKIGDDVCYYYYGKKCEGRIIDIATFGEEAYWVRDKHTNETCWITEVTIESLCND